MSNHVIEAPPRGRAVIRNYAAVLRSLAEKHIGATGPYLPIVDVLERLMPMLDDEFTYEVLDASEMGENHGLTIPSKKVIYLRDDIYERACAGKGRDRDTVAHEIGHYILHDDGAFPRRMTQDAPLPAYRDAEWQAKCFSGELLVSAPHARQFRSAEEAAEGFGVSLDCAKYQLMKLRADGLW